ncbi:MAG: thiamine biosynthesis protein ThiS [Planctomycetota bacterium]|jgi:thiamine biosynthesis protein ThiS
MIEIRVNGAARQVSEGTTLADLILELGLEPSTVAVERNRELVPRARCADTRIESDDRIELVTLVGGG